MRFATEPLCPSTETICFRNKAIDVDSSHNSLRLPLLPRMSHVFRTSGWNVEYGEEDHHIEQHEKLDRILSGFYSLAGGIIFGTLFIDLIPHVQVLQEKYKLETGIEQIFPVNYLLICLGFMLTYFFEECSNRIKNFEKKWRKEMETIEPYAMRPGKKKHVRGPNAMMAALTFAFAMSIHSFLEGFTLLQNTTNRIVELLLALVLHKLVEGLTTGQSEEAHREKTVSIITAIIVFAFMIPLGSAVGAFIDKYELSENTQNAMVLIFESIAGGIFLYVAMMEIITQQRFDKDRILHLWIIFIGFAMVALLHFSFGTIILRAAGGNEEADYPEQFKKEKIV